MVILLFSVGNLTGIDTCIEETAYHTTPERKDWTKKNPVDRRFKREKKILDTEGGSQRKREIESEICR